MSKRRRFLITSFILSLGFMGIQLLTDQNRFWAIGLLGLLTTLLFAWSLIGSIGKNMSLLTLVLPTIYTLGVGVFWFLLPANIYDRIPIVIVYGIGIYALCLTANIFSVAAIRTIALFRAARGVGFVLTLFTSFLVFDAIISLRVGLLFLLPLVFVISFPLYLQGFWTVTLETKFSKDLFWVSLVSTLVTLEIATMLYFWPVTVVVGSLLLTATFYMLLGLGQARLEDRLFSSIVREHLIVGGIIFVFMFFATHWGS
jgi:hypothetical protein